MFTAIVASELLNARPRGEDQRVKGRFPWTTFRIDVTGCALMCVLMVLIIGRCTVYPLARPFCPLVWPFPAGLTVVFLTSHPATALLR